MTREESQKLVGWTAYAHKRRMEEGAKGPWWDLIPADERAEAEAIISRSAAALNRFPWPGEPKP